MDTKVRTHPDPQSKQHWEMKQKITSYLGIGVIATPTERVLPSSQTIDKSEDVIEVQPEEPVKILETQGTFEHMMVWGHEHLPAADDVYIKGVEEWVRFAETVC